MSLPAAAIRSTDWSPPAGDWLARQSKPDFTLPDVAPSSQAAQDVPALDAHGDGAEATKLICRVRQTARPRSGLSRGPSRPSTDGLSESVPGGIAELCSTATENPANRSDGVASRIHKPMLLPRRPLMPRAIAGSLVLGSNRDGCTWTRLSSSSTHPTAFVSPLSASEAAVMASAIASGHAKPCEAKVSDDATSAKVAVAQRSDVAVLTSRLAQMERLNQRQAAKLAQQARVIDALRGELDVLRRAAADAIADHDDGIDDADGNENSGFGTRKSNEIPTSQADCDCSSPARSSGSAGGVCRDTSAGVLASEVRRLREERDHYRRQCEEMMRFLADYGLTWVGGGDDGNATAASECDDSEKGNSVPLSPHGLDSRGHSVGRASSSTSSPAMSAKTTTHGKLGVDLAVIMAKVEDLNGTVEKAGARIVHQHRVGGAVQAQLQADDTLPLPLTFFRDGVKLATNGFEHYSSKSSQQLIGDILDGYFPYVLKDDYPDGIAMKVVDRMTHSYADWQRDAQMYGDPDLVDGGDRVARVGGRALRAGVPALSLRQRSPTAERDVRNGQVLEVSLRDPVRNGSAGPVARVQVKLQGNRRVVFCMDPTQCVGDLEDAVAKWWEHHVCEPLPTLDHETAHAAASKQGPGAGATIQRRLLLRTAFPPKAYEDRTQTIAAAGLTPSATLFVACGSADGTVASAHGVAPA